MTADLRNFLEISYDELAELNLEAREKIENRVSQDEIRENYLKYLNEEKRLKGDDGLFFRH